MQRHWLRAAAVAVLSGSACGGAWGQELYFAEIFLPGLENGSIRRMPAGGGAAELVVETGGGLRSLDLDIPGGKIYWTDVDAFAIRRANLDGSGEEDFIASGLEFVSAVRLHGPGQRLYLGDQSAETILIAELANPSPVVLVSTPFFRGLAIEGDFLYWTRDQTPTQGGILRTSLSSIAPQSVVSGVGKPTSIAVDGMHGKIYWTDGIENAVRRANLDGSGVQLVTNTTGRPRGIAVDAATQLVYWGEDIGDETNDGVIRRIHGDGTGIENLLFGIGFVNDIIFVPAGGPAPCYANCDGSTLAPVLNVLDFSCFLNKFAAGESYANCDGSTVAPVLNVLDFSCFLNKFAAGCR